MLTKAVFWSRVHVSGPEDCWLWGRAKNDRGYGVTYLCGRQWKAHRVAFFLTYGFVPSELDHLCRVRACCNPGHLVPATRAQNMARMIHRNSKKTTCPRGHPYDRASPKLGRWCSTCSNEYSANYYRENREKILASLRERRANQKR